MAVNVIDRSLKALARRYPESFVRVVLGSTEGVAVATIQNPEINLPERRLDFVYALQAHGGEYLLHLEFQLTHEPDLPERMLLYHALLTAAYRRPVISAVIYLRRRDYRHLPEAYTVSFRGQPVNTFAYRVVKLWEYREAIATGELRGLAPLLVLLAPKGGEQAALATTRELILAIEDQRERADALSVAITVAARHFTRDFLFKFFREEIEMLQEASIVQEWINEGLAKGLEKGLAEGLERGRKEGKLEGEIETLRRGIQDVLEERFGRIKRGMGRKLAAIDDPAVLRLLHRKSVKVESLEEFARLLEEV
ncbi:MAG: Rpn family recombination-promoting nuclease/putative transposase [Desulfotomaculales bacterium]